MHQHTRKSSPAVAIRHSSTTEVRRPLPARHRPRRHCFQSWSTCWQTLSLSRINVDIEVLFVGNRLVLGSTVSLNAIPWANGTTMDPTNPSAAASGGAILPTCSTISSASSQLHHPNPAFGGIGGVTSGHGATGSGSGGGVGVDHASSLLSPTLLSPGTNTGTASIATSRDEEDDSSNQASSGSKGSGQRFSRSASRTPPKVHTSLVSRTASEDGCQRADYQSTQQRTSAGLVRRTPVPAHYQSIDRSHSFNDHDHDPMSRWYQYHQQRHPLSRTGSRTGSIPRGQRRRYSLRDDVDDDNNNGSMPTGLNRMVSFESVGGHSSCSGLLTRHRVSHPSVASSSFDQFEPVIGSLDSHQPSYQQQDELSSAAQHQQQQLSKSISNGTTRGAQSWKNLRAVMAYYCSLRKIKRTKSNQRWMKLRTTVQISSAMQKKPPLKREDSFLKRFSTRQIPEAQETVEDTGSEGATDAEKTVRRRRRFAKIPRTVVNPDENFYFYWLMIVTISILYNLWTLIVRQSFPELQSNASHFWLSCDCLTDIVFIFDVAVQLRTGYLEQGLMVYDSRKLAGHYLRSRAFLLDLAALVPLDILQFRLGSQPMLRFPRFFKVYRAVKYYYIVESRTVWPNLWRVVNLIHILLILAHWFGCFYFLLSEAEGFQGDWVYPYRPGDYATLTRKYLGSLYWSTLTLTTIGDLPTPETNAEYVFTIVSYLIGVFIFATIVGQVGNVITNRNANRLEFERLLDGAKTYMRHHKVPGGMKRRVLRWYDYSWSRGRIQGGGDINTALGLLPDKLKTELALHVNLSVLKKVTIFQECQPEFLHDLVLKMKAYIFTPGDSICRKGEVAREMFIIADGILEVLSETGKVLTTMKAGDFFGEIGILNLDGLNKRTADVRSVGYSELFSLSREDVLTAMKDYPEAQEILQTLGRKRLMEVRCVNKKHANKHAAKEHAGDRSSNTHNNQGDSSDNSASKRIVDKLRSDVKGLKNVLRKSRTGTTRRSNESIEMQPLHGNATSGGGSGGAGSGGSGGSGGNKTPKTMLKRMPRVKSDDIHTEDEGKDNDKVPSPIGAGLPLLQRLRLLKEKQDREERAAKATAQIISPPHTHVTSAISPQESIQEEPEPEVIGAGLPLMQRLKLLKAKEDRLAKESQSKLQVTSNQTSSSPSIVQSMSPTSPTVKAPPSPILNTTGVAGHHAKPTMRVSFKDRIRSLHHQDSKHHGESKAASVPGTIHETTDMKQQLLQNVVALGKTGTGQQQHQQLQQQHQPHHPTKPSTAQSLKDKIRSLGHLKGDDQLKPWSKLKLATVVSLGGSYTSLNNAASEESPILKQSKRNRLKTSIPADLNLNSLASMTPPPISSAPPTTSTPPTSFLPNKILSCAAGEAASVSDSEVASGSRTQRTPAPSSSSRAVPARVRMKPKPIKLVSSEPKSYLSIDDLSPEYCGLPFVKKLKILNERQKLAELESAIKTRSLSLDCTDSNTSTASTHDLLDQLTRSQSEGSGMAHTVRSKSESPKRSDSNGLLPLSPESNETLERRQLKSILKKLSEDKAALEQRPNRDLKKLMRAQTVEGYVARHSKFTKSVTFHRNTLSSPPSSAAQCDSIEERSLFPLLSAQTAPGTTPGVPHSISSVPLTSSHADDRLSVTTASIEQEHERYYQVLHEEHHHHAEHHREEHHQFHRISPTGPPGPDGLGRTVDDDDTRSALAVISNGDAHRGFPYDPHADPDIDLDPDGVDPTNRSSLSTLATQRKLIKGSLEEQEFFGEVLLGIKQVIQTHMKEIQVKFQDEFFNLELEVKKRDDIISKLQNRILELEAEQQHHGLMVQLPPEQGDTPYHKSASSGSGSTGSSNELPFMRGDSLDTIFASSPHSDSDAPRQPKTRSRKPRTSPRHRQLRNRPTWDESTDQDSFDRKDSPPLGTGQQPGNGASTGGLSGPPPPVPPRRLSATATSTTTAVTMSATTDRIRSPYRDLVISELTGNIISDSVIVNIEATSSSQSESQSETDQPFGEENEEEEEEEEEDEEDGEARQLMRHGRPRRRETEDDDEDDDDDDDCGDEPDCGEELEGEQEQEEEEAGNEEEEQEEEEQEEEEEDEEEEEEELNHNDWEVRMLAAELKKRESISTDFPSELDGGGDGLVRRRSTRKRSDTDTDGSDGTERDAFGRPRAASLDQHNLQRRAAFGRAGRAPTIAGPPSTGGPSASRSRGGLFKALSFDRDKDRL
ncbi:uncharacterized protein LOC118504624 isoform X4 [Anopheles stephensi]|uniref:uncharacterized protein LOC118504624 isoform X4 n=1 Tax=Anopheles stephensi TaxID=30069 RepID=UPI001658B74C|nr:uncharacterized protein LOC118504624 isoform X4 [Anopheles stephensi]